MVREWSLAQCARSLPSVAPCAPSALAIEIAPIVAVRAAQLAPGPDPSCRRCGAGNPASGTGIAPSTACRVRSIASSIGQAATSQSIAAARKARVVPRCVAVAVTVAVAIREVPRDRRGEPQRVQCLRLLHSVYCRYWRSRYWHCCLYWRYRCG